MPKARALAGTAQRRAFRLTDEAFYRAVHRVERPDPDAGATALAVLVVGEGLLVANAGDSRAVLSRRGRAIDLSRDHKPSCPAERERVRAAGAWPEAARSDQPGETGVTRPPAHPWKSACILACCAPLRRGERLAPCTHQHSPWDPRGWACYTAPCMQRVRSCDGSAAIVVQVALYTLWSR